MRIVLIVLGVLAALTVVAAVMIRRLDHDAGVWHVDPLTAPKPSTPNSYRVAPADADADVDADAVAPTFGVSASELAVKFDRVARDSGNVDVVGGSPANGFVTYVQISSLFAFPDYISVRFIEIDANSSTPTRLQGSWVTEEEVRGVVAHWRRQSPEVEYIEGVEGEPAGRGCTGFAGGDEDDDMLIQAMELVVRSQLGSTSMLQRKLRVGFARAGRLMDMLEEAGIVGPFTGSKARDVLIKTEDLPEADMGEA